MNNLNRILLNRLKQKHQKLSKRFLKAVEEGNFQQLNGRKKYQSVERLKKIERQLKELGKRTGDRINLSFRHWAVALSLGLVISTSGYGQKKEPITFSDKLKSNYRPLPKSTTSSRPVVGFNKVQQLDNEYPRNIHIGDFDGDGDNDIFIVPIIGGPFILFNDGASNFTKSSELFPTDPNLFVFEDGSTVTDIDMDGDLDIIIQKAGIPVVDLTTTLYINDGSAGFTPTNINLPAGAYGAFQLEDKIFADIDGDGDQDIVDAQIYYGSAYSDRGFNIYLNDGSNNFTADTNGPFIASGSGVSSVINVVDIDGDGDLDIPLIHTTLSTTSGPPYYSPISGRSYFRAFTNNGSGVFTDAAFNIDPYTSPSSYFGNALMGDIDGDGDIDALWYESATLFPVLNNSSGNFTPQAGSPSPFSGLFDVNFIDINNDGFADITSRGFSYDSTIVYQGDGAGQFVEVAKIHGNGLSADFDGDNDKDFLVADGDIFYWDHQSGFNLVDTGRTIFDIANSNGILAADVDGDSDIDLVQIGEVVGSNNIWLNDGTGYFSKTSSFSNKSDKAEFADMDSDGDLDLLINNSETFTDYSTTGGISIFTNNSGVFSPASVIDQQNIFINVFAEDLDGDTDKDIVAVGPGTLEFLINNGGLNFIQGDSITTGSTWKLAVNGDIDGDSDVDFILAEAYGNNIALIRNNAGVPYYESAFTLTSNVNTLSDIKLVDIDGDGDLDLIASSDDDYAGYETGVFIMTNDGTGNFTDTGQNLTGIEKVVSISPNDIDSDGDIDLLVNVNYKSIIFENDGLGSFTNSYVFPDLSDEYSVPAFGDFDGDGDVDIAFSGKYSSNSIFFNLKQVESDSIALVAFYNATNGDNWTNTTNNDQPWLVGDISGWYGVTADVDGVSALSLPNNNIEGSVPPEFNNLRNLVTLDLSNNLIDEFQTDLSGLASITSINLSDNMLDFGDFELIGSAPGLVIGNQSTNDQPLYDSIPAGNSVSFSFNVDGTNNVYQWYRNGNIRNGLTNSTVNIATINRNNMGEYYCEASNPDFPSLTLTSATKSVLATAVCTGNLNINDTDGATVGELLLMKITNTDGFDTTNIAPINSAGEFIMNNVILGDYILAGVVDTTAHPDAIPTYFGNTVFWAESDTLFVDGDVTADIVAQFSKNPTGDIGNFFGYLEQVFPDGGRTEGTKRVSGAGVGMRRGGRDGRKEGSGELVYYVYTNDNGEFNVDGIAPGLYNIDIQYPGYPMDQNSFLDITIGSGDKDKEVSVEALVDKGVITVRQLIILGTDEVENGLLLFPNPTKDFLQIQDAENRKDLRLELFNSSGQSLKSFDLSTTDKISVNDLPVGQYIVSIFDKNGKELLTRRIIVQY